MPAKCEQQEITLRFLTSLLCRRPGEALGRSCGTADPARERGARPRRGRRGFAVGCRPLKGNAKATRGALAPARGV